MKEFNEKQLNKLLRKYASIFPSGFQPAEWNGKRKVTLVKKPSNLKKLKKKLRADNPYFTFSKEKPI